MDLKRPDEVLAGARKAASDGDVTRAAELYEYFYEHALESDRHLSGVRLSYCIMEWADLADRLPSVKTRLNDKRLQALEQFDKSGASNSFHDYMSLCELLGHQDEAVQRFLRFAEDKPEDAGVTFHYIWKALADAGHYAVCARLMGRPQAVYDSLLRNLDHMLQMSRIDARFSDPEFLEVSKRHFIEDARRVLAILKHGASVDAANAFAAQVKADLHARKIVGLTLA